MHPRKINKATLCCISQCLFLILGLSVFGCSPKQGILQSESKSSRTLSSVEDPYQAFRFQAGGRVVAIGDLHGDAVAMRDALILAGAIDSQDHWIGGNLVLVQTGDQIDRWDNDRQVLDFFANLKVQAEAAGGRVISLNGNHEIFNVQLLMNFVTPESFKEFLDFPPANPNGLPFKLGLSDPDSEWGISGVKVIPSDPGVYQRVHAFRPGGPYARLLAARPFFAIVNDTVFVHGGITRRDLEFGLPKLNQGLQEWMLGH